MTELKQIAGVLAFLALLAAITLVVGCAHQPRCKTECTAEVAV
jgi:uncharacterized lipoprotein YajG